jgi:hypothetical protein
VSTGGHHAERQQLRQVQQLSASALRTQDCQGWLDVLSLLLKEAHHLRCDSRANIPVWPASAVHPCCVHLVVVVQRLPDVDTTLHAAASTDLQAA